MLTYNTHQPELTMPEYGRSIQKMVDHCLTIADRDERTRCAYAIVTAMGRLNPKVKEQENWKQILWDHLAAISHHSLDIDWPVEPAGAAESQCPPLAVPYPRQYLRYRHYGKDIEMMIDQAVTMEDGQARDELTLLIANHMKKQLLAVNKDGVTDAKVFKDLLEYSHGLICLDPETTRLHEFKLIAPPSNKKKKKH